MTDLSMTIAPKSDQLNADDLIGGPRTITITRVSAAPDSAEQPINVFFEGDNGKPYRPCKSMRRVMVQVWGARGDEYVGKSMTIYRDPEVQFGGMKVGGIRISHMSGIEKATTMALTATRAKRAPYTVQPLRVDQRQNDGDRIKESIAIAEREARRGREAFNAFWNSDDGKARRGKIRPHMDKLKSLIDAAEAAIEEDPFGLPPTNDDDAVDDTPRLSPEEEERIQREIAEAAAAREAEGAR